MSVQAASETKFIREPRVAVIHNFGRLCPAGYRVGERIRMDTDPPGDSFKCSGAFIALQPFIEAMEARSDQSTYPACRFLASCDCPLTDSEVVFQLFSEPVPSRSL